MMFVEERGLLNQEFLFRVQETGESWIWLFTNLPLFVLAAFAGCGKFRKNELQPRKRHCQLLLACRRLPDGPHFPNHDFRSFYKM